MASYYDSNAFAFACSLPTVGWKRDECTGLLRDGDETSRAASVFAAVSRLDRLFAAPPAACVAAAQKAFCQHLRPVLLNEDAAERPEPLCFAELVTEATGLASAVTPARLEEVAARCLRRESPDSAALGFWASAGLLFLLSAQGGYARATARWLHALPFAECDDRANANEFVYCLTALLSTDEWSDAGSHSLAADLRSVTSPRVDACLLPPPPGRRLTREQAAVVDAELKPGDVAKVVAFAGAGKTSTLRAVAEAHPEWRTLFTAFNASVVADGKKAFAQLGNVTCATTHVLAGPARNELQSARKKLRTCAMSAKDVCAAFPGYRACDLCPALLAAERFLVTDGDAVTNVHVQLSPDSQGNRATIVTLANLMVTRMMDPDDDFPFTFNAYLRKFVLSEPQLPYDCILVDESQDLNPITIRLLLAQTHARRIFVGDSHQHIYAFNGTRDCLSTLPTDASFRLTRSFRFGADVAAVCDKLLFLKGETTPLRGGRGCATVVDCSDSLKPEHFSRGGCMLGIVRYNVSWLELAATVCSAGASVDIETPANARLFLNLAQDILHVAQGQSHSVSQANRYRLARYRSLDELETVASEAFETDLIILAAFVRKNLATLPTLLQQLRGGCVESPAEARAMLSTTHKAKGCEYDDVFVCEDLQHVVKKVDQLGRLPMENHDDLNLLYVAITRARRLVTLPTPLMQRLDTYAKLQYIRGTDAVEACTSCSSALRGVYVSSVSHTAVLGPQTTQTCAACAARGVKLGGHGTLHYALLPHLAWPFRREAL